MGWVPGRQTWANFFHVRTQIVSVYKSGRKPLPDTGCICCCLLLGWFSLLKCKKMFTLPSQCFFFIAAYYYELQLYSLVKMLHWEATSESLTTGSLFKPLAVRVTACAQVCGRPALSMTVLEYCGLSMDSSKHPELQCWAAVRSCHHHFPGKHIWKCTIWIPAKAQPHTFFSVH